MHLVAQEIWDLTDMLRSVGDRDVELPLQHGRGDEVSHGSFRPDPREGPVKVRDIYIPDLHIDQLKVKARDFR